MKAGSAWSRKRWLRPASPNRLRRLCGRAERLRLWPPILCARQLRTCRKGSVVVSKAKHAVLLCSAARECLFRGKILRDIFICLRLVCPDNREGRKKSALLRGQSLGRMRSRRGYSLPPETGNRSDAFKLQGLGLAFFLCNHLLSPRGCQTTLPNVTMVDSQAGFGFRIALPRLFSEPEIGPYNGRSRDVGRLTCWVSG